eukprot:SM000020S05993  [mRNA]  locus=s20:371364:374589:+ [translate_table: standard]
MLDCGVHLGHSDDRRYPDFRKILGSAAADLDGGDDDGAAYTAAIDCVLITHFHLDHVGALPYFTEVCGYRGPVYMTYPTKALAPLMLEDYRKIAAERRGEAEAVTPADIRASLARATAVDIRQTVDVGGSLRICAYYAGHVLGAAMFHITAASGESVVYTGDFSTAPDRHLGPASIDRLEPDLLISEWATLPAPPPPLPLPPSSLLLSSLLRPLSPSSPPNPPCLPPSFGDHRATYATTVRDSKRLRERDFLRAVSGHRATRVFNTAFGSLSFLPPSTLAALTSGHSPRRPLGGCGGSGPALPESRRQGPHPRVCTRSSSAFCWTSSGSRPASHAPSTSPPVPSCVCCCCFWLRRLPPTTVLAHVFLTASASTLSSNPSSLHHSFFLLLAAGLTAQANVYYKLLIGWTNQKVKATHVSRNTFDFHHGEQRWFNGRHGKGGVARVAPFERGTLDAPGPCVLFATPGMLTGGLSLEAFRKWAPNDANMVVLPGYCMAGTVGAKLMAGKPTVVRVDKRTTVDVRCEIFHLSFSAHADAKGILDLARTVAPRCAAMLVHGERAKMAVLAPRLAAALGVPVLHPPNLAEVAVPDSAPGIAKPTPLAAIPC